MARRQRGNRVPFWDLETLRSSASHAGDIGPPYLARQVSREVWSACRGDEDRRQHIHRAWWSRCRMPIPAAETSTASTGAASCRAGTARCEKRCRVGRCPGPHVTRRGIPLSGAPRTTSRRLVGDERGDGRPGRTPPLTRTGRVVAIPGPLGRNPGLPAPRRSAPRAPPSCSCRKSVGRMTRF